MDPAIALPTLCLVLLVMLFYASGAFTRSKATCATVLAVCGLTALATWIYVIQDGSALSSGRGPGAMANPLAMIAYVYLAIPLSAASVSIVLAIVLQQLLSTGRRSVGFKTIMVLGIGATAVASWVVPTGQAEQKPSLARFVLVTVPFSAGFIWTLLVLWYKPDPPITAGAGHDELRSVMREANRKGHLGRTQRK